MSDVYMMSGIGRILAGQQLIKQYLHGEICQETNIMLKLKLSNYEKINIIYTTFISVGCVLHR